MKKIKIGIIGNGFIGKQHIEAIRRVPGTYIAAVVGTNVEMAKKICEEFCIPKYYANYKEMLEDETIDIVHNCTPSSMHYSINKDTILSGRHIYCEKPLTLTAKEAEELVKLAKDKGVCAAVNFNYRHNAMVREMYERVRNKQTGKILSVHGEYLQDWLLYDTDYNWRMDPKIGGESRAIADIGSHCFDTIQYILDKKIVSVYSNLTTVHSIRKEVKNTTTFSHGDGEVIDKHKINSEDEAYIMTKFEDGTKGLFHVSQVCAGKKNYLHLTVSGEKFSMEWNQEQSDKLWIGKRESGNEELFVGQQYLQGEAKEYATLPNGHPVGWADAFKNAIHSYYTSIRNESYKDKIQGYSTFNDAWYIMKIVEACLESNKQEQWISIK